MGRVLISTRRITKAQIARHAEWQDVLHRRTCRDLGGGPFLLSRKYFRGNKACPCVSWAPSEPGFSQTLTLLHGDARIADIGRAVRLDQQHFGALRLANYVDSLAHFTSLKARPNPDFMWRDY